MMNDNGERLKKETISILERHPEGLTIQDLSEMMGVHRQTITKYVMWLEGAKIVHRRRVGSATLHYLKKHFKGLGVGEE